MSWKKISRKTIYDNKFLKVFEDKVKLPNGNIHEKYSVVKFPDIIIIVATDFEGKVITINEYKYGTGKIMRSLPAGHIEKGEDPQSAAKRELLEETGYGNGEFELEGRLHELSTKNFSTVFVVRATKVEKISQQHLDENEDLSVSLITKKNLREEIDKRKWEHALSLASFTLTGILNS